MSTNPFDDEAGEQRARCLEFIEENVTDRRPRSLREATTEATVGGDEERR